MNTLRDLRWGKKAALCFLGLTMLAACAAPTEEDTAEARQAQGQRWKVLNIQYQIQETGYWCGPSATRVALSARVSNPPSQAALANELGTDVDGTDWIGQVTNVLNRHLGPGRYMTKEMPNDPPRFEQKMGLWNDIVVSIDQGYPVVANIVAPAHNHPPGYPNYTVFHYIAVIGYNPDTWEVFIADSANFSGKQQYWLKFDQLASLIPPKGYSSLPGGTTCANGSGSTVGEIDVKYRALGGCNSVLGIPLTEERGTPDRRGRYNVFERGSIYWTQDKGAFEVHGVIRDHWKTMGWESGVLGYPVTDEMTTPDKRGRYNHFEKGSIYWTQETGAHEVMGRIRDAWAKAGWETGLGYPISGEVDVEGGKKSDFEKGSITWNRATDTTTVTKK